MIVSTGVDLTALPSIFDFEVGTSRSPRDLCTSSPLVLEVVTFVADNHAEVEEVQFLPHSVHLV